MGVLRQFGGRCGHGRRDVDPQAHRGIHEHRVREPVRRQLREPPEGDREDHEAGERLQQRPCDAEQRLPVAHLERALREHDTEIPVCPRLAELEPRQPAPRRPVLGPLVLGGAVPLARSGVERGHAVSRPMPDGRRSRRAQARRHVPDARADQEPVSDLAAEPEQRAALKGAVPAPADRARCRPLTSTLAPVGAVRIEAMARSSPPDVTCISCPSRLSTSGSGRSSTNVRSRSRLTMSSGSAPPASSSSMLHRMSPSTQRAPFSARRPTCAATDSRSQRRRQACRGINPPQAAGERAVG